MGKYRATVNMSEAKRYAVAEFPDDEPRVIRMVLDGHLIPVDVAPEVKAKIEDVKVNPPAPVGKVDEVRAAMVKAREEAALAEDLDVDATEEEPVMTSFTPDAVVPETSASTTPKSRKG